MTRTGSILLVACALLAGGAALSTLAPADVRAGDAVKEAQALKAEREKFRKTAIDRGEWPYHDLSHSVRAKEAKLDGRWTWSNPPVPNATENEGVQFIAQWENKLGAGADITIVVQKWEQKNSAARTKATMNFAHAGMQCDVTELEKMCNGFCQDWLKQASDPVKDKCQAAKKVKGMGPAEWYACAVATDGESKKRERREFFIWATPNTTWYARIIYQSNTLDKPDWLAFGVELFRATKELGPPH